MHYLKVFLHSCLFFVIFTIAGCQVVSVENQSFANNLSNERDSILNRDHLSQASLNVLSVTASSTKRCIQDPEQCLDKIKQFPQIQTEQYLSTASEVYLAKALQLQKKGECKAQRRQKNINQDNFQAYQQCLTQQLMALNQSIRHAYAYLFHSNRQPQERLFDNRQVQVRDFYNQAIADFINIQILKDPDAPYRNQFELGKFKFKIDQSTHQLLDKTPIERIQSTYNLKFSGLDSISRRDGFGVEFVTVLAIAEHQNQQLKYEIEPLKNVVATKDNPNIHQARYLATTLVARPKNADSIDDILNTEEFIFQMYDPYRHEKVEVAGKSYPLAANFSAPYGLWLSEDNLAASAYLGLISRDQRLLMPQLFMLEPYNPDKKIIVLVHGLASSPETWIGLTNDIMGDPLLRENYQVWQVFYSTNMPIIESRYQIHALLKNTFDQLDPTSAATKDSVLIGHSMGGIIAKLLVSDVDLRQNAVDQFSYRQRHFLSNHSIAMQRFEMNRIKPFSRAVLIAAPIKGTDYADLWFTRVARRIIKLPTSFLKSVQANLESIVQDASPEALKEFGATMFQNGASDLSSQSDFVKITKDAKISPEVTYHTILGNRTDSKDKDLISDGIVPYWSAHIEGAESEKIIRGGHSIQHRPEAVLELRRILREHLLELRQPKANKTN